MTAVPSKLSILFCPLLSTITQCLELPKAEHNVLDQASHKVSITVRALNGSVHGVYVGGPSETTENSFEKAAQLAICDLKQLYDIYVKDVTALRNQESRRCTNLWRLKRQELQHIFKDLPKNESIEEFELPEISHLHGISIDFVHLLKRVNKELRIACSDIEVIEHTPSAFKAWATITHHNSIYGSISIYGDISASYIAAEQNLAAKVVTYLVPIYNLEIIDANSETTKYDTDALVRKNIEDKCQHLKEAVLLHTGNSKGKLSIDKATVPITPAKNTARALRPNKVPSVTNISRKQPVFKKGSATKEDLFI